MPTQQSKNQLRFTRHRRVRAKIAGTKDRPRLSLYRSNKFIYASLIDDEAGRTLVAVSSRGQKKVVQKKSGQFPGLDDASGVGLALAKAALAKKIDQVVFDRGGYRYLGQVAALAKGARDGGLKF